MAKTVLRQTKVMTGLPLQGKILGSGVILELLFLVTKQLVGFLTKQKLSLNILDVLRSIDHWLNVAIVVITILLILFLTLWLLLKYLYKKYFDPFYLLERNPRFYFWLQSVGLYISLNRDNILLPNIRRVRQTDNIGAGAFEIEILADYKDKMLSLNEAINVYLSQNYSKFHVVESYEVKGWVRYVLSSNFQEEQLRGDDLGL